MTTTTDRWTAPRPLIEHATDGTPVRREPDPAANIEGGDAGIVISTLREVVPEQHRYDLVREMVLEMYRWRWARNPYGTRQLVIRGDELILLGQISLVRDDDVLLIGTEPQGTLERPGTSMRRAIADGWSFAGCTPAEVREMLAMWVCERVLGDWDRKRLHRMS